MLYDIYTMNCKNCSHTLEQHEQDDSKFIWTPSLPPVQGCPQIILRPCNSCDCKEFKKENR